MQIEDQVSNVELSLKLKEAGVPQDAYFMWRYRPFYKNYMLEINEGISPDEKDCAAFSVPELGRKLPDFVEFFKAGLINAAKLDWKGQKVEMFSTIEANLRAEVLLSLIHHGMVCI